MIVVLAYAAAFAWTAFHPLPSIPSEPGRFEFPTLKGSLVALLGVSSFFYLAIKAGKLS